MKENFIEAVSGGDIFAIRLFLTHELKQNPNGKTLKKMCQYAEVNVDNIFDLHDGKILNNDKTLWNEELMDNIQNDLDNNFSKERFDYLADVSEFMKANIARRNILEPDSNSKKTETENKPNTENVQLKEKFIESVKNNNVIAIRLFLANELMLDPRGNSFKLMRDYADNNSSDLYEVHNGENFVEDQSEWNQEFLFNVRNDLDSNFSRERLGYFEMVCKVVLKDKALSLETEEKKQKAQKTNSTEPTASGTESESNKKTKHNNFLTRLINEKVVKPYKEGLKGE